MNMTIKGAIAGRAREDPFQETIIWDINPKKNSSSCY